MATGAARGRRDARRQQQVPKPIDVDELFEFEIVGSSPTKAPIDGVELIGSAARARVLGVNKGFRNFPTTEGWKKSKVKEARRLERQKAGAVDLTGDDDGPGPSKRRATSTNRSSTRGASARSQTAAMDVDRAPSGGHQVIEIPDSEDEQEPGPGSPGSPMRISPTPQRTIEPEPEASDSEDSWFAFEYDEPEEDGMDLVDDEPIPSASVDKGKGRAWDINGSARPLPARWRQKEMPRFDIQNRPFQKKSGKVRLWDWDVRLSLPPTSSLCFPDFALGFLPIIPYHLQQSLHTIHATASFDVQSSVP